MTLSEPGPASLRQTHIDQIETLFRDPPSLLTVAQEAAQAYLDQHFATQQGMAGLIHIGTPTAGSTDALPSYAYQPLPELLVQRLAGARPTLLVEQYQIVVRQVREVFVSSGPTLAELEKLINECGAVLLRFFSNRLQMWWREPVPINRVRWGYLSDHLLALLYDSPKPPGLDENRFAALFPKNLLRPVRPTAAWSLHGGPLRVQTVHLQGGDQIQMLPLLVFSHASTTLLFSPASGIHVLNSLDDIGAMLPAYTSAVLTGAADHWFVLEAQGDPFDALASSYLARQLLEIDSIQRTVPRATQACQALLDYIIDPRRWFICELSAPQQRLRQVMPGWLAQAGPEDSIAYAQLLQQWVLAQHESGAAHFLEGIESITQYADRQVEQCLRAQPGATKLQPGDVSLTFDRVIAAAVPVPGGFIAGEVDPVTVTLTELALENLAGFPHTVKRITLNDAAAPTWLTYSLIKCCVDEADVGQTYPALLKKKLIDDTAEVTRRRQQFSRQLRVQLPMLALESKIKGEYGVTRSGFQLVLAALQASAAERQVGGQAVALWPLAFKASANAAPDVVANMFIIGPQQGQGGPHLLYRPLFSPMLQEYESLEALFTAIKTAGVLQDNVLTWLAPARQAVYANNGFHEPHIRRFLPGDEFSVYEAPAPAQLSKQVAATDPADQVFNATAQALVALADRQSVSNAEQRWADLKQAGWLLLGTVLPYLNGPLMLGGWLAQLVDSAQRDIQGLQSDDGQARSAALTDMLANLMAIVAHQATPQNAHQHLALEHPVFAPLARVEPAQLSVPLKPVPAPATFYTPTRWANARDVLTPQQRELIQRLRLKTFPTPWPVALDNAEPSGAAQGLLRDTAHTPAQWQALVRGALYRVQINQGVVRVVSADGATLGPWLRHLGQGRWDFDLRLRFPGGNPDEVIEHDQQAQQAAHAALEVEYTKAQADRTRANTAMHLARALATRAAGQITDPQRTQAWERYGQEMSNKFQYAQRELQLLKRLRELGPRLGYEVELCQVLESVILTAQLLDAQSRRHVVDCNARLRPLLDRLSDETPEEADSDINRQDHAKLRTLMRELAAVQETAIRWRTLEAGYLDELSRVPRLGRDKAQGLTLTERPLIPDLQTVQLTTLWGISIDITGPELSDDFFDAVSEAIKRARRATRSLADLQQLQATPAERIELLKNIDHVYAQVDDQIEFWRAMEPEKFDLVYLQKLQELLASLHQQVENELVSLLQPEPQTERPAAPAPVPQGTRRKKIIRTRNHDMYVAQINEATSLAPVTAELHEAGGELIGTFTEAQDGVWEPVRPTPKPDAQLGSLLKKAQGLLDDERRAIQQVDALIERINDPSSLEYLLEAQANTRRWTAESIDRRRQGMETFRLVAVQQAKALAMARDLRLAEARLKAAGVDARIRATRLRPTTQEHVDFLLRHDAVRIFKQGERVRLKGKTDDYLQVYVVADARDNQRALCYAHFHYKRPQGPDDHYEGDPHIKSPEQERLGREAQAQVEAQAFARIRTGQTGRVRQTLEIDRAKITRPFARRLFFSVD
ncbi:hypothetical protein [Pseudomonas sp. AM4(2022)]|uniref:hypothetical protein n=1 Tax=Pseudomonas sp. AM4(2022) TaxID=2983408 RepID=UPI002E802626|nr:hypothetical protein [Pseudomonas sp. AM4(2022)]